MKKHTIELTEKELKALHYHLKYDIETIGENHNWEDIELDESLSSSVLSKIEKAMKKRYKINAVRFEYGWVEVDAESGEEARELFLGGDLADNIVWANERFKVHDIEEV